jgi:hypothetical protein
MQGLDEEILERMLQLKHQSWSISIFFIGSHSIYIWPISFKLFYFLICLSTISLIFIDIFVFLNKVE